MKETDQIDNAPQKLLLKTPVSLGLKQTAKNIFFHGTPPVAACGIIILQTWPETLRHFLVLYSFFSLQVKRNLTNIIKNPMYQLPARDDEQLKT